MASLCPEEQDVRAARRNMVPFIYTHSRVERETETVSSREKDQDYRPNRKETTRGERMNQKQKETEELEKKITQKSQRWKRRKLDRIARDSERSGGRTGRAGKAWARFTSLLHAG